MLTKINKSESVSAPSDQIDGNVVARPRRNSFRKAAMVTGMTGMLVAGVAGVAQAAQSSTLSPGQSRVYSTYFFGRTEACFRNVSTTDASYAWSSATTNGGGGLVPGASVCTTRSFVGIGLRVTNLSAHASIAVTFPIGP
jgi:hypothetical protein